ncbi:MAG: hypothetical protein ACTHMT_06680, partial [Verrucomicrobiota bacterium]
MKTLAVIIGGCAAFIFSAAAANCSSGTQFGEPNWVGTIDTPKISEASGLAASRINPAILWTHNDGSGGKVYAIGTNAVYYGSFDVGTADDTED